MKYFKSHYKFFFQNFSIKFPWFPLFTEKNWGNFPHHIQRGWNMAIKKVKGKVFNVNKTCLINNIFQKVYKTHLECILKTNTTILKPSKGIYNIFSYGHGSLKSKKKKQRLFYKIVSLNKELPSHMCQK